MDMDSVIVGQRIASRRKPLKIVRSSTGFIYAPQNWPLRRKRGKTSSVAALPAAGIELVSKPESLHQSKQKREGFSYQSSRHHAAVTKVPKTARSATHITADFLAFQTLFRRKTTVRPATSYKQESSTSPVVSRYLIIVLVILAILLTTCCVLLFLPESPAILPDYSRIELPTQDNLHNVLLETIMAYEAEVEEMPVGILPITLDTFNYRVQPNDTLDVISRRHNIRVETLISLNAIRDVRRLQAGTIIKIPNLDGIVYTVKSGDSLAALASRYSKTVYDLVDANDLASQVLRPGQVLFIPGARMPGNELKQALGTLVIWPLRGIISSPFGYRNSPFTGVRQLHSGIDIVGPMNTPIKAAMDGRVAETGFSAVYGNFVILSHFDGYQTLYAHLNRISVRTGVTVTQGATVGLLGSTGLSTGPHLHFGVYRNGRAINPLTLLQG